MVGLKVSDCSLVLGKKVFAWIAGWHSMYFSCAVDILSSDFKSEAFYIHPCAVDILSSDFKSEAFVNQLSSL